jgi:anion-transporting  ArsA/GET3 family ATPase
MTLRDAINGKEIVVVCGAGGVGKTSVSAALALAAARDRNVMVVTIDPAKRLAAALGLGDGLAHTESRVAIPGDGSGSLHAAMLDMKTAWDELIDRHAESRQIAEHIKSNRIYRGVSEQFVGSQGYMAMERLAHLHEQGKYDLIVVDTPPTRSALDFLEAPKRMTDFIGGSLLRWMAKPYTAAGRFGARAFNFTASPFLRIADRVLGSQVLEDLSSLVMDFQSMYEGFKTRAEQVLALLGSPSSSFVVVTTLEGPPLAEAGFFIDRLLDEQLPLAGIVANKVVPQVFADASPADAAPLDPALRDYAHRAIATLAPLSRRDEHRLTDLHHRARVEVAHVPLFTHDVHDLEGLAELGGYVTGGGEGSPGGEASSFGGASSSRG